ncbi:MAG TPA: Crp/Fnr family transcriptional regulator, partial [Steroidobacteraceae bacterium]|nr:Crp/Fnr family transcriptional regulator [Steroidobacteraceae bacterium]
MHAHRLAGTGAPLPDPAPGEGLFEAPAPYRRTHSGTSTPAYRWIRRLSRFATFTPEEQRALEDACASTRRCAEGDDLVKAGDPADRVFVILDGLVCQQTLMPDGRRQILAYLFAGDMCDPRQLLQNQQAYAISVIWPSEVAALTPGQVQRLERLPNLALAMGRFAMMQQTIAREWLVNVGHRTALERLGHLLCEACVRLDAVGLAREHAFELPLTQAELGDTLALSAVHVNRT